MDSYSPFLGIRIFRIPIRMNAIIVVLLEVIIWTWVLYFVQPVHPQDDISQTVSQVVAPVFVAFLSSGIGLIIGIRRGFAALALIHLIVQAVTAVAFGLMIPVALVYCVITFDDQSRDQFLCTMALVFLLPICATVLIRKANSVLFVLWTLLFSSLILMAYHSASLVTGLDSIVANLCMGLMGLSGLAFLCQCLFITIVYRCYCYLRKVG